MRRRYNFHNPNYNTWDKYKWICPECDKENFYVVQNHNYLCLRFPHESTRKCRGSNCNYKVWKDEARELVKTGVLMIH